MARLTRTQKYAELRDRLSQDREEPILSAELEKYEKKLQSIEDAFSSVINKQTDVKPEIIVEENVVQEPAKQEELPKEVNPIELIKPVVLEEPKIEETKVEEAINEKIQSIEDMVEAMVCKVEEDINKIKPQEHERVTSLPIDEEIVKSIDENKSILDEEIEDVKIIENDPDTVTFDINEILDSIKMEEEKETEVVKEELQEPVHQDYAEDSQTVTEVKDEVESIDDILDQITNNAQVQEEPVDFETFDKEISNAIDDAEKEEIIDVTPVIEEKEEIYPPKYETVYDAIDQEVAQITDLMDPSMKPAPIVEEEPQEVEIEPTIEVKEEPVVEVEPQEELPVVEEVMPEEITIPNIEGLSIEETPTDENIAELDEEITSPSTNFISETLKEVDQYNKDGGRQTLDTLPGKIIEEVRRSEKSEPEEEKEDELFSQTVSLELDKVLSEISNTQEMPKEEIAELEKEEPEKVEEHPSLALEKEKEEEGVVEIKNISETLKLDTNVLEDTIPFEINKPTSVEEDYDDDLEDETSSKVLNVVLGILIVVLLLVLGIIVYYILVARGILG